MTSTMKRARRSCNVGTKDQEQEELFDEGITSSSVVHPKRFPVDILWTRSIAVIHLFIHSCEYS